MLNELIRRHDEDWGIFKESVTNYFKENFVGDLDEKKLVEQLKEYIEKTHPEIKRNYDIQIKKFEEKMKKIEFFVSYDDIARSITLTVENS
jgi:predicted Mrr-cat superfamily restriction endonuclease